MCESPVQNSAAQVAGHSPAARPPGSQVTPAIPSGRHSTFNSSDNDENLFLKNIIDKTHFCWQPSSP